MSAVKPGPQATRADDERAIFPNLGCRLLLKLEPEHQLSMAGGGDPR